MSRMRLSCPVSDGEFIMKIIAMLFVGWCVCVSAACGQQCVWVSTTACPNACCAVGLQEPAPISSNLGGGVQAANASDAVPLQSTVVGDPVSVLSTPAPELPPMVAADTGATPNPVAGGARPFGTGSLFRRRGGVMGRLFGRIR